MDRRGIQRTKYEYKYEILVEKINKNAYDIWIKHATLYAI